jgi:hypothetical protein
MAIGASICILSPCNVNKSAYYLVGTLPLVFSPALNPRSKQRRLQLQGTSNYTTIVP